MSALEGLRVAFALPRRFDVNRLLADLSTLRRFAPTEVGASYGRGRWEGVSLHAPRGRAESLACSAEPYWGTKALAGCPYMREILASFEAPKRSVRVLTLGPGARVFEHYDPDSTIDGESVRLHIPIVTHPDVDFFIGGFRVHMRPGELWYGDFALPHRLRNRSAVERVHLVMDLEVTDAIRRLFPAEYLESAALRRIHRAARRWLCDQKTSVKGLLAQRLG